MSHVVTFSTKTPLEVSQKMLAWAKLSCPGYITNGAAKNHYEFYFETRADANRFFDYWASADTPMQIIEYFG